MPITTIAAVVGAAKQASAGTLAANPTFAHGVAGGAPIAVEITHAAQEVTTGRRAAANVIRESSKASFDVQSPAYLRSMGLYLLGALGTVATTGTTPNFTHAFATGDLPYLSMFLKGVGTTNEGLRDCKVDEFTLAWENSKPLTMAVKGMGTVFSYPSTFTPTVDDTAAASFLVPVGGTFQVDTITGTPAAARVISGEITVKNNVASIDPSGSVQAGDVQEGIQEHTLKLTIVPDDLAEFRKTVTGATNGTAVASTVSYGSVNLVFRENGGTGQLAVTGSRVAFLTAWPEVDPKGGTIELELAGVAVLPVSGGTAPLVYTLQNSQTTY